MLINKTAPQPAGPAQAVRRPRRSLAPWVVIEVVATIASVGVFGTDQKADLAVLLTAGKDVVHGINPYVATSSPQLLDGHAFVYPWLSAWLFAPLAMLPSPVGAYAFTLLGAAAVLVGARLLHLPHGWAVAALLLCAPFARNLELGAVNTCFFLLLAALWHWRERTWVVAASVTLLVGLKLFLAPIVVWVILTRSWRCTAATLAALSAFLGCSFVAGPLALPGYVAMLHRLSDHMGHRGMSLESAVAYLTPTAPARPIALVVAGLAIVASVAAFFVGHRRNEAGLLGALVIVSLLGSPMVWRHYFLLLFFVLVLLGPSTRTMIAACAASWAVIGSATLEPVGGLALGARFLCLYASVAILFCLCLTRKVGGPPNSKFYAPIGDLRRRGRPLSLV